MRAKSKRSHVPPGPAFPSFRAVALRTSDQLTQGATGARRDARGPWSSEPFRTCLPPLCAQDGRRFRREQASRGCRPLLTQSRTPPWRRLYAPPLLTHTLPCASHQTSLTNQGCKDQIIKSFKTVTAQHLAKPGVLLSGGLYRTAQPHTEKPALHQSTGKLSTPRAQLERRPSKWFTWGDDSSS